ncbi:YitT family protein [Streptomyces ovatisporus]|uniref:YitT family protein n=1 Tax=Streptomyces ovatisporus TaxID=1128682 RepID=A0ABV9A6I7_9ACTN
MTLILRRFSQQFAGCAMYGLGIALQVNSGLGNAPWDVLHHGLARRTSLTIGTCVVVTAALALLLWIPLRQRPGIGTVTNAVALGPFADLFLHLLPDPNGVVFRSGYLVAAIVATGIGTGCCIGSGLGPGPRDGLMTGIAARGHSIRLVRTGIEVTVLTSGWLLGGAVGIGTLLFALTIGPLAQLSLRLLSVRPTHLPEHGTRHSQ